MLLLALVAGDSAIAVQSQEKLILTVPVVPPAIVEWTVDDLYISVSSPELRATLISNTGERFVYRYAPDNVVTAAQVRAAISYINTGKFKTINNTTLQAWLLAQISAQGVKVGTVSGGL